LLISSLQNIDWGLLYCISLISLFSLIDSFGSVIMHFRCKLGKIKNNVDTNCKQNNYIQCTSNSQLVFSDLMCVLTNFDFQFIIYKLLNIIYTSFIFNILQPGTYSTNLDLLSSVLCTWDAHFWSCSSVPKVCRRNSSYNVNTNVLSNKDLHIILFGQFDCCTKPRNTEVWNLYRVRDSCSCRIKFSWVPSKKSWAPLVYPLLLFAEKIVNPKGKRWVQDLSRWVASIAAYSDTILQNILFIFFKLLYALSLPFCIEN
jgi:hypothetical protein